MAGLNLTGIHVMDLELAPVPLTRYQVRSERAQGGLTVRLVPGDPDSVEIRFFDANGADIGEANQRKIERLLYREDFRRVFAGDIGDILFPPRAIEFYTAALEASVDAPRLRKRAFKVVLDYSYGAASTVMPNVLSKIGAEVLAVNPYAATASATEAADADAVEARVETMRELVRASSSDLGFVFDPDGETAVIIDDRGDALTPDQALLVLVHLVCQAHPGARLALPVAVSRGAERIAARFGAHITWTKLSAAHLMEIAGSGAVDFAASQEGGFIWPDVLPAYDATATLVKLLDLLAHVDRPLSEIVDEVPDSFVVHETVPTPWEKKGTVMRGIMEWAKEGTTVLVDGIKAVYTDGWALVLPDPELAFTHVWAEGDTEATARRLLAIHAGKVAELTA